MNPKLRYIAMGALAVCIGYGIALLLEARHEASKPHKYLVLWEEKPISSGANPVYREPQPVTANTPIGVALLCHANFEMRMGIQQEHSVAIDLERASVDVLSCIADKRSTLRLSFSEKTDPFTRLIF